MHLDDELVQRLIDREPSRAAGGSARVHLDACADCRQRVERAGREEAELRELLELLDHPAPFPAFDGIVARAHPRSRGRFRWAAMLLLAAGLAGVAYAAPGSPLRAWIMSRVDRPVPPPPAIPPGGPAGGQDSTLAGIALPPGARLVLQFASAQETGEAVVTLVAAAAAVTVRAPTGAATFLAGADTLLIDNRGAGAGYLIEIPVAAPRVEIRLGGTRLFLKDGPVVTTRAGRAEGPGPYRLPLGP
jgi:hypothetical protein